MTLVLEIDRDQAGRRLDHIIRGTLPGVPLSTLYRWIRQGAVRLNGRKTSPAERPQAGDRLTLPEAPKAPAPKRSGRAAGAPLAEVPILLETRQLLLLNKPAFLNVQPGGTGESLIEQVWRYLDIPASRPFKPALLNRLDREVSGVVAVAKEGPALRSLSQAMRSGGMEKTYLALVFGRAPDEGRLDQPLPQAGTYRKGLATRRPARREKAALTEFRTLWRGADCSLLQVRLHSGRKHQIRQHLAAAGLPLIGDGRYGETAANRLYLRRCGLARPFLHALRLAVLPPHQPRFQIVAPLPPDLRRVLQALGPVEKLPGELRRLLL